MLKKIFPFLDWFKDYDLQKFKIDFISGLTVALVLIPQSMAYAQLAGLPPYFGLYAAFLPPMVAALFGSSRQLQTGPVAIVSLMTSASLEPLATAGSQEYIMYAIILAITVGVFQLALGVLRLGLIINFLSHPVVNGFTNAAALIIASSQLSKVFGVFVDREPHYYQTIYNVVESAFNFTHIPTLLIAILAIGIMYGIKKYNPKLPYVLIAVVVTTLISYFTGYVDNRHINYQTIAGPEVRQKIELFNESVASVNKMGEKLTEANNNVDKLKDEKPGSEDLLKAQSDLQLIQFKINKKKDLIHDLRAELRLMNFIAVEDAAGKTRFYQEENAPAGAEGKIWRLRIGNKELKTSSLWMMGGGDIVGKIPEGLPELSIPDFTFGTFFKLLPFAIIISLLGFMEAIAIAKAMASKTGQRIDPNQELVGQGLGNIIGAIGKSYPVSGSFSRSAVNLSSGALTGLSSVVTSVMVVIVLMFFTPLLYFLPKAVLATIIMMAVIGLVNIKGIIHTWKTKWYDGTISVITFVVTLAYAPHLEIGIYTGVALSLGVFLYRSMRPRVASLSRHQEDHSLRDSFVHKLPECKYISLVRFEGPLFFANASYLEEVVDKKLADKKDLKHIIFVCNAITDVDATGEEALSLLIQRLRSANYGVSFSGVNETVMELFKRTHLYELIGEKNLYATMERAVLAIYPKTHDPDSEEKCPLISIYEDDSNMKGEHRHANIIGS